MKRIGSVFLSFAVLFGLTAALEAQSVEAANDNTSIEIDGGVETTIFRRGNNVNTILNGGRFFAGQLGISVPDDESQTAMLYNYHLGLTAEVGDHVTGRLELENPVLNRAVPGAGANDTALIGEDGGTFGSSAGDDGENVQISEAYVEADRFLAEGLTLTVGIQNYETDLRGDGNPFFLDLQGSEAITDSRFTVQENRFTPQTDRNLNDDAGGVKLTVDAGNTGHLDLFWFTVREFSSTTVGSTVGNDHDEHVIGTVFNGSVEDQVSYQVVATLFRDVDGAASSRQNIWTFGGGVDYAIGDAGSIYGEAYIQGGERDAASDQDTSIAVDLGYAGESGSAFWDFSVTHVEGDDGSDRRSSDDNEDFVSYEDNDDTMILEDNVLGLDVDTNYQKVQLSGGFELSAVNENDLSIELLAAWAQSEEEVDYGTAGISPDDELGVETDLIVTWSHSESLDFELGLARLWSGDFWSDSDGFNTASDDLDLYTFTANLNF